MHANVIYYDINIILSNIYGYAYGYGNVINAFSGSEDEGY